jgi:hypothetical protein
MAGAIYLYCVVRATKRPGTARVAGLPGAAPPRMVAAGRSLWLVVSDVPLDLYGPERVERALRDLEEVARIAVAHEAVVEHFARRRGNAVVPMKLFTMFSTERRAVEAMQTRRAELGRVLKRVAGCEEWGVRVTRGVPRIASRSTRPAVQSGAEFLAARKQVRDSAREAVARASAAASAVFEELSPIARDARRRDDSPAGAVPPLLDAAFLVPSARRVRFRAAARRAAKACAGVGADMTLTGPWPAYNFVQTAGAGA